MTWRSLTLDDLAIDDARSFDHVALYARLERVLRRSGHRFLVPPEGEEASWDRVVFLNLTFWSADPHGADVLCEERIPADVVAHVAWHHLAAQAIAAAAPGPMSAEALLFGEAIASAFDLYLVGRLLRNVPDAEFVASQVPILSDVARNAGMGERALATMLEEVTEEPERAFEDLRALLFDVGSALVPCRDVERAAAVLDGFGSRRFAPLLHHYELSNWVLYARAHGASAGEPDAAVRAIDAELRAAPASIDWLDARWVEPALAG